MALANTSRGQVLRNWALALVVAGEVACAYEPGTVAFSGLPPEAQATERLVRAGGPFPHTKDGTVFGNREGLLPYQSRGYYLEYTVDTPGSPNRGARRIVCGGEKRTVPVACYYTQDHYASFRRIVK